MTFSLPDTVALIIQAMFLLFSEHINANGWNTVTNTFVSINPNFQKGFCYYGYSDFAVWKLQTWSNNGSTTAVAQESISNLIKSISSLLLTRSPEPRSDHIQINKISLNKEAQMDYYPFSAIVLKVIRVLQDRQCVKWLLMPEDHERIAISWGSVQADNMFLVRLQQQLRRD